MEEDKNYQVAESIEDILKRSLDRPIHLMLPVGMQMVLYKDVVIVNDIEDWQEEYLKDKLPNVTYLILTKDNTFKILTQVDVNEG